MITVLTRLGEQDDGVFDWMIALEQQRREREALKEMDKELREQRTKPDPTHLLLPYHPNTSPKKIPEPLNTSPQILEPVKAAPPVPTPDARFPPIAKPSNSNPNDIGSAHSNKKLASTKATPVGPPAPKKKKWWHWFICGAGMKN